MAKFITVNGKALHQMRVARVTAASLLAARCLAIRSVGIGDQGSFCLDSWAALETYTVSDITLAYADVVAVMLATAAVILAATTLDSVTT